jgi:hypothetical protein
MATKAQKSGKVGKVLHEFKHGELHSGSKKGPKVTSRPQAIAIGLSEAREAGEKVKPPKMKTAAGRKAMAAARRGK